MRFGTLRWCRNGCYNQCPIMIHHVMIRSAFGGFRRRCLLWPGASTTQRSRLQAGKILKPIPIQFLRQRSCYHMLSYVIIVFIVILHFSPYLCCFFLKKGLIFQARDTSRWPAEMGWAFWHLERHEPQIWIDGFYHHTHTHIYICIYTYTYHL